MNTDPASYTVAMREAPQIICPPWCLFPKEQHLDELKTLEGFVVHIGDTVGDPPGCHFTSMTFVDGTPSPHEPEIAVRIGRQSDPALTPAQTEEFAHQLLAAVREVRG